MTHPNLLALDRHFAAAPAFVFSLWSHPALVSAWWGPDAFHLRSCEIDFRPGGNWRFHMVSPQREHWIGGTYHQIAPEERLMFSYRFPEFGVQSIVSLAFAAEGQGTRLRFLQTGFPNEDHFTGHKGGWTATLSILEDLILKLNGIGSVYPTLPPAKVSSVAEDLMEARRRHDEDMKRNA